MRHVDEAAIRVDAYTSSRWDPYIMKFSSLAQNGKGITEQASIQNNTNVKLMKAQFICGGVASNLIHAITLLLELCTLPGLFQLLEKMEI